MRLDADVPVALSLENDARLCRSGGFVVVVEVGRGGSEKEFLGVILREDEEEESRVVTIRTAGAREVMAIDDAGSCMPVGGVDDDIGEY